MRCFIGIGLPPAVRDAVANAVRGIGETKGPVSWVAKGNLHVTLKFLGEIRPERVSSAGEALAGAVAGFPPFTLDASGGGTFPGPRNPRVLWVGFREPLELVGKLQQNIENALSGAGFPREDRPFHPHITVGRVRGVVPPAWGDRFVQGLAGRGFGIVPVSSIVLFESRLAPGGAIYSVVREFPFGNDPRRRENEEETAR
ncbi:MAG: RNA 2',3'-cyclic phosphodiesterase [Deltaproteobacteria bacterium]|nr:RNA 2',3'-cyclic phosphodiesterase [Deltaproteobacteria bacterium]